MRKPTLLVCLAVVVVVGCSYEAAQRGGAGTRLPADIQAIVSAAPFNAVAAFAGESGSCTQVYAIALTWLNAQAAMGLLRDPISSLEQLDKAALMTPSTASADPSRAELVKLDRDLCRLTVEGNRELILLRLAELVTWSGQKELGLTILRAARTQALSQKPGSREIFLSDIGEALLDAQQRDEALALGNEFAKPDAKADFTRKMAQHLVELKDCPAATTVVAQLEPREQADISVRCLAQADKWADALKQLQSVPGADRSGARGYLETNLTQRGHGADALRVAQALAAQLPSYSAPSSALLRLIAAEGAPDDVLKLAAKIPDYSKLNRVEPYIAVVAAYRKGGRIEEADRLFQEARQIAEKASGSGSGVRTLVKALRANGLAQEADQIETDERSRDKGGNATSFDGIVTAAQKIDAGQTADAVTILVDATEKLKGSDCKKRTEIAFQYGRLQKWADARRVTAICTASELKAGSGVDAAWRLYGDAFLLFQYVASTKPEFGKKFTTFSYNDIYMKTWFKLNVPLFWAF